MPCHIHHGPPGSYKSFGVIQDEVVPALQKGRVVVTNIRGLDSIERIEEALGIEIHDDSELINIPHNAEGDALMRIFFHWLPMKALIVIDELQRIYSKRDRKLEKHDYPGGQVQAEKDVRPYCVENAFDQHRHYGWDIFCTTPNILKVHPEIREVCEYGYRHRDVTGFLPWYINRWKEVQHTPDNSGQSASHALGEEKVRKADPRYFDIYQSVAIDDAEKQNKQNKNILKQPKIIAVAVVLFFTLSYQAYFWNDKLTDKTIEVEISEVSVPQNSKVQPFLANNDLPIKSTENVYRSSSIDRAIKSGLFYFVGTVNSVDYFEFKGSTFKSNELEILGYEVGRLSNCLYHINDAVVSCKPKPPIESSESFGESRPFIGGEA